MLNNNVSRNFSWFKFTYVNEFKIFGPFIGLQYSIINCSHILYITPPGLIYYITGSLHLRHPSPILPFPTTPPLVTTTVEYFDKRFLASFYLFIYLF